MWTNNYIHLIVKILYITTEKRFIPFASLICPHIEFKGSPTAPRNVLYDTSFNNYPFVRLLFPSILSIPLSFSCCNLRSLSIISNVENNLSLPLQPPDVAVFLTLLYTFTHSGKTFSSTQDPMEKHICSIVFIVI
jgi:hypothetical protein